MYTKDRRIIYLDIEALREALRQAGKRLRITTHAQTEAAKDGLLLADLYHILLNGQVVETSEELPRALLYGNAITAKVPVHIVVEDADAEGVIITAYIPDHAEWESNWKRRKHKGDKR